MLNGINKVELVKEILKDEVTGNVKAAKEKTHRDYTMTWVEAKKDGTLFPRETMDTGQDIDEIYKIEGRSYELMNIVESENVVMVEVIEIYPDPKTGKVYRTPEVIVLEFEGDKIKTGRHYCDPALSYMNLTKEQVEKAYADPKPKFVIN